MEGEGRKEEKGRRKEEIRKKMSGMLSRRHKKQKKLNSIDCRKGNGKKGGGNDGTPKRNQKKHKTDEK